MSACWTLVVLLLCARGHRAEDPRQDPGQDPRQDPRQDPERDALEVRRAGTLTRGARRGAPSAGFSPERVREDAARPEEMEPSHRGDTRVSPPGDTRVSPPGDRGSVSPGDRRRFPRGTKGAGRRRDRTRSTLDPDRFFTTPRTAPPPVNASVRAALLPLGAGARWAYAVLLLALVLFSVGLVGNLALMCLVWHSLHLKSAWNCVLAGLALWDFLVLFFCVPVLLLHQLTGARLALSCSLVPFLEVSSMGVATFSLCALSIDRFHSATSPAPLSAHVESCTSILPKLAVVFVGSLLLAAPELLVHRHLSLPLQDRHAHYNTQVDVCVAEPSPELPLAVLSLVLTYQEARSWWVFGCYLCLPLLFTLSCDLVTRRVMSQRAAQAIGRQEGSSRSSSPSIVKKEVGLNRSPALSVSKQEVSSHTSSLNRKLVEREAGLRSVILALIGLYSACTLPEAACSVAVSYLPALPAGVSPALRLIGQFLLFARCSATPLLALAFSRALGGAFLHCCCCCCDECGAARPPATPTPSLATPTPSLATPSTLLATPLSAVAPPLRDTPTEEQWRALGTPC